MTDHRAITTAYAAGGSVTTLANLHKKAPETIRRILRLYGHPVPVVPLTDQLAGR